MWDVIDWLFTWYRKRVLIFSINTGILVGLITYTKMLEVGDRKGLGVGSIGTIFTILSTILFVCCAPYTVGLILTLGSIMVALVVFSKKLFVIGLLVQWIGIAYMSIHILRRKTMEGSDD
jgi:hypothetical protein